MFIARAGGNQHKNIVYASGSGIVRQRIGSRLAGRRSLSPVRVPSSIPSAGRPGPLVFDEDNAAIYGRFLGERYRDRPLVWILGGDKFVGDDTERRVLEAMVRGLKQGDHGAHLMTFHPTGQYSSAIWFHDAPWLDFKMVQTGHTLDRDNFTTVLAEYQRRPIKPVVDGEPGYENIPHAFDPSKPRLEATHVRRFCYWALYSGAFGHTYVSNDIWQMWAPGRTPLVGARLPWQEAMDLPSAGQMGHARALIEGGPFSSACPTHPWSNRRTPPVRTTSRPAARPMRATRSSTFLPANPPRSARTC